MARAIGGLRPPAVPASVGTATVAGDFPAFLNILAGAVGQDPPPTEARPAADAVSLSDVGHDGGGRRDKTENGAAEPGDDLVASGAIASGGIVRGGIVSGGGDRSGPAARPGGDARPVLREPTARRPHAAARPAPDGSAVALTAAAFVMLAPASASNCSAAGAAAASSSGSTAVSSALGRTADRPSRLGPSGLADDGPLFDPAPGSAAEGAAGSPIVGPSPGTATTAARDRAGAPVGQPLDVAASGLHQRQGASALAAREAEVADAAAATPLSLRSMRRSATEASAGPSSDGATAAAADTTPDRPRSTITGVPTNRPEPGAWAGAGAVTEHDRASRGGGFSFSPGAGVTEPQAADAWSAASLDAALDPRLVPGIGASARPSERGPEQSEASAAQQTAAVPVGAANIAAVAPPANGAAVAFEAAGDGRPGPGNLHFGHAGGAGDVPAAPISPVPPGEIIRATATAALGPGSPTAGAAASRDIGQERGRPAGPSGIAGVGGALPLSPTDGAAPGAIAAPSPASATTPESGPSGLLDQVTKHLVGALAAGDLDVTMRLHPPELGGVNVHLQVSGRDIAAWFDSPLPLVQQALAHGIGQLQTDLAGAGYNLNGAWVGGDAWTPRERTAGPAARASRPAAQADAGGPAPVGAAAPRSAGVSVYV